MIDISKLIRFVLVGGSSGVLALFLTWVFVSGLGLQITLGSTTALTLTAIYNYCLHYFWTFTSDAPHGWVLVRYLLMCLGALVVNALVMHWGVNFLPIHYLFVQVLATAAVIMWTFCMSSFWVFRSTGAAHAAEAK